MKRPGSLTSRRSRTADRVMVALVMGIGVIVVTAGLLWLSSPNGQLIPVPSPVLATGRPTLTARATPGAPPSPATTATPIPSASPDASPPPSATPPDPAVATRIVVSSLHIDLPIISRDLVVPHQDPDHYPPCDVALYYTLFKQPGLPGTTYLYAHARRGMFLPLLTAAEKRDPVLMIGMLVDVYTNDDLHYVYAITIVKPHGTDFSITGIAPHGTQQLVLQTSEGPPGTGPKLQVLASLQDILPAGHAEAHPKARPRACYTP